MKSVTILCLDSRRDATVADLRRAGVLHVTRTKTPSGPDLERTEELLGRAERALGVLESVRADAPAAKRPAPCPSTPAPDAESVVEEVLGLVERQARHADSIRATRSRLDLLAPFGEFDPRTVDRLARDGMSVRLFKAPFGETFTPPPGGHVEIAAQGQEGVWLALIAPIGVPEPDLPWEPIPIPEDSPARMRQSISEMSSARAEAGERLLALTAWRAPVVEWLERIRARRRFFQVREGMETVEGERVEVDLACLTGYCPETDIPELTRAAARAGLGLLVDDPTPAEDVPTLVRYANWVKPIRAVFDFLQISPGYREADVSMVFLVFFSVFFGMLIGDAGYGLLLLIATVAARLKLRRAPAYPFVLFGILGGMTVVWGALTGNYFGSSLDALPAPLRALTLDWLAGENKDGNIMGLCFLIGAVHLTIAHTWNIVSLLPDPKAFEQVGWIGVVWSMYYAARALVLREEFPSWAFAALGVSLLLIILFMTPVKRLAQDFVLHLMLPLNIVSCFVDLVSYVRLFAVGMASFSVAYSFNNMALGLGAGSAVGAIGAALILLLGHSLNIALCALGILVHGVRLNTLEFSIHKNMTWSGFPYDPFREEADEVQASAPPLASAIAPPPQTTTRR